MELWMAGADQVPTLAQVMLQSGNDMRKQSCAGGIVRLAEARKQGGERCLQYAVHESRNRCEL